MSAVAWALASKSAFRRNVEYYSVGAVGLSSVAFALQIACTLKQGKHCTGHAWPLVHVCSFRFDRSSLICHFMKCYWWPHGIPVAGGLTAKIPWSDSAGCGWGAKEVQGGSHGRDGPLSGKFKCSSAAERLLLAAASTSQCCHGPLVPPFHLFSSLPFPQSANFCSVCIACNAQYVWVFGLTLAHLCSPSTSFPGHLSGVLAGLMYNYGIKPGKVAPSMPRLKLVCPIHPLAHGVRLVRLALAYLFTHVCTAIVHPAILVTEPARQS
eukprot:1162143-Pelagomonas_calceolata.AAC.9